MNAKCEVVLDWQPTVVKCGKPTVAGYPAMGGGRMALCVEHVEKHIQTPASAKALDMRTPSGEPYGWGENTK